jgi:hypothetical protein
MTRGDAARRDERVLSDVDAMNELMARTFESVLHGVSISPGSLD